ncbi:MAG: DMT family protein [Planctomycetota bacterium]
MQTWALLVVSNVFMTFAWYGHLKNHKEASLPLVIFASWGIAFFEYCFMIPANRLGSQAGFSTAQLKTMQEVVTLAVFIVFSLWYLGEPLKWNYLVGFLLIGLGAAFIFKPW